MNNMKILGTATLVLLSAIVVIPAAAAAATMVYAQPGGGGVTSPPPTPTPETTIPPSTTTTTTTTTATNVSSAAQQIIDSARAECEASIQVSPELQGGEEFGGFDLRAALAESCVSLVYESATTVVLDGDLLINVSPALYGDNPYIWQAVDQFKAQGYAVENVITTGQGSQGNPHRLYIVMSK